MANPTKSNYEKSKTDSTVPTQVKGRDMITGKVVSITEYLERKRRQAAEYLEELKTNPIEQQPIKAYEKLLNKTVSLGITPSGQKVTGKFIRVKKIIKQAPKAKTSYQLNSPEVIAKVNNTNENTKTVDTITVENENNTNKNIKEMSTNAPFLIKIFRLDNEATSNIEKNTVENIASNEPMLDNKIPSNNEANAVKNQTYFDPNFIKNIIQNFREIPSNAPALVEICSLDNEIINNIETNPGGNQINFDPIKINNGINNSEGNFSKVPLMLESFSLNNEIGPVDNQKYYFSLTNNISTTALTQKDFADNLSNVTALGSLDNKITINIEAKTVNNSNHLDPNLINNTNNNPEIIFSNPPFLADVFSLDNEITSNIETSTVENFKCNPISNRSQNVAETIFNTTVPTKIGYNMIKNNQIQNFEEIPSNVSFLADPKIIENQKYLYSNLIHTTVQNNTEILPGTTVMEQSKITEEDPNLINTNQKFEQSVFDLSSLTQRHRAEKEILETTHINFDSLDLLNGILEDHQYTFNSEKNPITNVHQKNNLTSEKLPETKKTFERLDFFNGILEDHKYTFNFNKENTQKMDFPSHNTCLKGRCNLDIIKNNIDDSNIVENQNKILPNFGRNCSNLTQDNIKLEENTFDTLDLNDIFEEHKYTDFKFNFVEKNNPEIDLLSQILVDHTYTDYKIDPLEGINPCDIMEGHRHTDFGYSFNLNGVLEDPFYNETVESIVTDHPFEHEPHSVDGQLDKDTHSTIHSILTNDKSDDEDLIENSLLSFDALKHHSYSNFSKQLKNKCKKSIPTETVNQHEYIKTKSTQKRGKKRKKPKTLVPKKKGTTKYLYNFTCEICNQVFKNRLKMLYHMETRVCQDKKIYKYSFTCKNCSRKFGRKTMLQKHEKICGGDKPFYVCSICGAIYKNQTSLTKHRIQIHWKQRDKEKQLNFEDVPMEVITEDSMILEEGNNASKID